MSEVEKIVHEVAASFRIDNINVPSELIYNCMKELEIKFSEKNKKGKSLIKKVDK